MPNVSDEGWTKVKEDVFSKQIIELNKMLAPIYKKHSTHDEIKDIIAFYQTELDKKWHVKTQSLARKHGHRLVMEHAARSIHTELYNQ